MIAALETSHLTKRFGGLAAIDNVSFRLERGARHALIGPNGAGKTTFINLLTGTISPTSGTVRLNGEDVTRLRPDRRVRRGLARTFQINQLFLGMSPLEALTAAASEHYGLGGHLLSPGLSGCSNVVHDVAQIAAQFGLEDVLYKRTSALPYGKQRLVEIALAFASRPQVLLLDEPAAGVPEEEREDILQAVANLPRDVSVLLIEHDMDLVFRFAGRISVLAGGALLAEGSVAEVASNPDVRTVYLGEDADA
jgi:ABC-type branched-subunit amino acid transport system ATPase component